MSKKVFFLFLLTFCLIKADDTSVDELNIDPNYWKTRDANIHKDFNKKFSKSLEISDFHHFEIVSTNDFTKEIENFGDNVPISLEADLHLMKKKNLKIELKLCGSISRSLISEEISMSINCEKDKTFSLSIKLEDTKNKIDLINLSDLLITIDSGNAEKNVKNTLCFFDKKYFTIKVDSKELTEEQMKEYTLNKNIPFFNEKIKKYHYTTKTFELNLANFNYEDIEPKSDFCFSFDYFSYKNSMTVQLSDSKNIKNENLFDLVDTNIEDNGMWYEIKNFCLLKHFKKPDLFSNDLSFKLIVKETKSKDEHLFAISNFKKEIVLRKPVKSFFAAWHLNENIASNQWITYPYQQEFLNLGTQKFSIKANFENGLGEYNILSEIVEYTPSHSLNFKIKSGLNKFHLSISIFNHLDEKLHEKTNKYLGSATDTDINYDFKEIIETHENFKQFKVLIKFFEIEKIKKDKNEIEISDLYFADPCLQENLCSNNGICKPESSTEFSCICDNKYIGENCQFENKCIVEGEDKKTGKELCNAFKTECLPIDDKFECLCAGNKFWDKAKKECIESDKCSSKVCEINQNCVIIKNEATCEIRKNYFEIDEKITFDLCHKNNNPCKENENCLSYLGLDKAICVCKEGYYKFDDKCEKIGLNNPFIKQKLGCEQLYKFEDDKVVCDCHEGYFLKKDKKRCKLGSILKLTDERCKKCNSKQICALKPKEKDFDFVCLCKIGFENENCEKTVCESKNNEINSFCNKNECSYSEKKKTFECSCDSFKTMVNSYGQCQIKEFCGLREEIECRSLNSVCVPLVIDSLNNEKVFTYECKCKKGYEKNSNNVCVSKCVSKCDIPFKDTCMLDLEKDDVTCKCRNGYYEDEISNTCKLGKSSAKFNLKVFFNKASNNYENSLFPKNDYLNTCNEIPNDLQCLSRINSVYEKLNKYYDDDLVTNFVENELSKIFQESFENIFYQNGIKLDITSFKNLTDIDSESLGINSVYDVEILLSSNNEKDETILTKQFSIDRLKLKCLKSKIEKKDEKFFIGLDQNYYNEMCLLSPNLLVLSFDNYNINEQDLCEVKDTISCGSYSKCQKTKTKNLNSYECSCKEGFQPNHIFISQNDLKLNICEDINECESKEHNDCESESTFCENLIGNYKCNCKENYKSLNQTHCEAACKDSSKCLFGNCIIFEKHYERCSCQDGYQGESCTVEDKKVRLLKNMLIAITICLNLVMTLIILSAYLYLKSMKKKYRQTDTPISTIDDVFNNSNNNYERF